MLDHPVIKFHSNLDDCYEVGDHVGLTWWTDQKSTTEAVIQIVDRRTARLLSCSSGFGVSPDLLCGHPLVAIDVSACLPAPSPPA